MIKKLSKLLSLAQQKNASDVHLCAGAGSHMRTSGAIVPLAGAVFSEAELQKFLEDAAGRAKAIQLTAGDSIDFAYGASGLPRCRMHAFQSRGGLQLAVRLLRDALPPLEASYMPSVLQRLAQAKNGLLLIGGCTGAGKSTTAGMLLEWINRRYAKRIVTLEDPVEYVFQDEKSFFMQREYGRDFADFSLAVRDTLRQDADLLFIGEIRDKDIVAAALTAAETGRLVLATLHCADAVQALTRLTLLFPADRQQYIRFQLASALRAVVAQRLLPMENGAGVAALQEILIATPAVRNLIRENQFSQLCNQIELGSQYGMQTFSGSLMQLKKRGLRFMEANDEKLSIRRA